MMASTFDVEENRRWAACIADAEGGALPLDIHTAASLGDQHVVLEALERDPNLAVLRNDFGWSPLMFAVWQGHESLVVLLLRAALRVDQQNGREADATDRALGRLPRSGRTLLMIAARFGYLPIVRMLCKPNALEMRDFRGQTPLFHAVRGGNDEIIRFLVSLGANVNACDNQGQTVLRLAERCRPKASCELLRDAGAKLEIAAVPQRFMRISAPPQSASEEKLGPSLTSVLEGIALQKYLPLFQLHDIDFKGFLAMSEDDLRRIGVSLLGPRRKMAMEIDRLKSLYGISESM